MITKDKYVKMLVVIGRKLGWDIAVLSDGDYDSGEKNLEVIGIALFNANKLDMEIACEQINIDVEVIETEVEDVLH